METVISQPSNQENQDPGQPGTLRSMFFEGMTKIGTQRWVIPYRSLEHLLVLLNISLKRTKIILFAFGGSSILLWLNHRQQSALFACACALQE